MNEGRAHVLISYAYFAKMDLDDFFARFPERPLVFADSGAFSAYNSGMPVQLPAYIEWLRRWRHHFTAMANLDVLGFGPQQVAEGAANMRHLERAGLDVVPVYHGGEPLSVLEDFVSRGYRYIAVGGAARKHPSITIPWLVKCFQIAQGRAVLHGFGTTWHKLLFMFPWYSADSSTWANGRRYGELRLFDYRTGQFVRLYGARRSAAATYGLGPLLREHLVDPALLMTRRNPKEAWELTRAQAVAWKRCELWLRNHRPPVSIEGQPDAPKGPIVYLALPGDKKTSYSLADAIARHAQLTPYVHTKE